MTVELQGVVTRDGLYCLSDYHVGTDPCAPKHYIGGQVAGETYCEGTVMSDSGAAGVGLREALWSSALSSTMVANRWHPRPTVQAPS